MIYTAVLHERDHRKCLFLGEALNCVASAYNDRKIIKMTVDTDTDLDRLKSRVAKNFAPYLSSSEVVKIFNPAGEIVATIRSQRVF